MPTRPNPHRVYLDANVLIAYLADEPGRADVIQAVLHDARNGRTALFTSVLSIAEVAYISAHHSDAPASHADARGVDDEAAIDELWYPASPIGLLDVSVMVAREARKIIRQAKSSGMRGIRSADAIHLASATVYRCDRFFTYENEASRAQWQNLIQANISDPFPDEPPPGY